MPAKTLAALTPLLAIIVLGTLEAFALSRGINGVLFAGVAAVIGGLGGYEIKRAKDKLITTKKEE